MPNSPAVINSFTASIVAPMFSNTQIKPEREESAESKVLLKKEKSWLHKAFLAYVRLS